MKLQRWQDAWSSFSDRGQWVDVDRSPTDAELAIATHRPDGVFVSVDGQPIVSVVVPSRAQTLRVLR